MNRLHVWVTLLSGAAARLGEIVFDELLPNGTAPTAFRYARSWLDHPDAFPLTPDPQVLPLLATEFHASNLGPPLQVLNDALPDDWGRRLIVAEQRLPRHQQGPFWIMRAVGGNGLGALSFSEEDSRPPQGSHPPRDLASLVAAAVAFDAGQLIDDAELKRLYAAGATPGGARPKVLVESEGTEWIAKLPSLARDHGLDVVGLEATCLALALCAGLSVPEFSLVELGSRRALFVRRFDIAPAGGRAHMLSLSTLCQEAGGVYCQSYDEPAAAVRKFSDDPGDLARFFRQMVFNAAIGNTDDHLKNFVMLRDGYGYRLSPAFDLVPDIGQNGDHVLAMGHQFSTPRGSDLVEVGRRWLGKSFPVQQVIDEVVDAVSRFKMTAAELGVAPDSIVRFEADISRRLAIIRS